MLRYERRKRPDRWHELRARVKYRWAIPFVAFEWGWDWMAFLLSNWSFLEVLEYLGSFSVLAGVIFYFSESGDRIMQRHYQAWQVINTAEGKGGSGGRIDALQELNADRIPLTGVDASSAFLQAVRLAHANLTRSNFSSADLRDSDLRFADLTWADLHYANLRNSSFEHARFDHADLRDCDFTGARLAEARFDGADLTNADLRAADLRGIAWQHIAAIVNANIAGVRNAPDGFVAWALHNGAVDIPATP